MRRSTAWVTAAAAVVCAGLSLVLPWAHYGGITFSVLSIPGWPVYVAAQSAAAGCAVIHLSGSMRAARPGLLAVLSALVAAGVTGWLISRYNDASLFFDAVVPMVRPRPGLGGAVGLLGALAAGAVAAVPARRDAVTP
ncbi:hypothetical protein QLQ12_14555 [Actinoplanes sp. NEAU-A12]|uniref:Uncharacterized protein n=1 Tax=Actinoplanes sandaracinus TaxID=3045177 RepID=A0ABT6WJB6_9ACTN|nr:hypothetical protein [Actinoplanes sandaracinus]MDI6099820.1 hypothetical protein [Actinoplanes sandaracinus]